MNNPVWVDLQECLAIQVVMLTQFGGIEGIRDDGLLGSALNRPQHLFAYGQPTLFDLAAEYAFGIIKKTIHFSMVICALGLSLLPYLWN